MDPDQYTGSEWKELSKVLTQRQLKNALKCAYRAEAKKAVEIAQQSLASSPLNVKGNTADWKKGIRSHIYSKGGGFLVTVKARGGKKAKGMHTNRKGITKPVLMWAEEGTAWRKTRSQSKFFVRKRKGHYTGKMRAYGFLKRAEERMYREVEAGLLPEVQRAVVKVAAKAGFA